jgi:hypothetical protein
MVHRSPLAALLALACAGRGPVPLADAGPAACGTTTVAVRSQTPDLDLLLVIDNSIAMAGHQNRLIENIDVLLGRLASAEAQFQSVHLGVVSTDVGTGTTTSLGCAVGGDRGRLQDMPRLFGCTPPGDRYIQLENDAGVLSGNFANVDTPTADGLGCQGLTGFDGEPVPADGDEALDVCDIQAAFGCIAALGTSGCGFEQPLESARLALTCTDEACTNPGFRRQNSTLGLLFLSNEDDCSARRDDLFGPSSALGPADSFRCFEFGVTCTPPIDRTVGQVLEGCRSKTVADAASLEALYLHPVDEYYEFLSASAPVGRIFLAGLTGPYEPGDTIETVSSGSIVSVEPSCLSVGSSDDAAPAVRTNELIRRFGQNGLVAEDVNAGAGICTEDDSPVLAAFAEALVRDAPTAGCVPAPLTRTTASEPVPIDDAVEASCTVSIADDTVAIGSDGGIVPERAIERCVLEAPVASCVATPTLAAASPAPCWYVCDAAAPEAGGCPERWRIRSCADAACLQEASARDWYARCESCDPSLCDCAGR